MSLGGSASTEIDEAVATVRRVQHEPFHQLNTRKACSVWGSRSSSRWE